MSGRWWTAFVGWWRGLWAAPDRVAPGPAAASPIAPATASAPSTDADVPDWAAALATAERFRAFENAVLIDLQRRGITVDYNDGIIVPQAPGLKGHQWGLANLAQLCSTNPVDRWASLIAHHFDIMIRVGEQEARVDAELREYSKARLQLVPRLWDEMTVADVQQHAIFRRDIPGLVTVLSIDLPESIRTVSREMLERWGVGEDQAFARAFDNLDSLTERKLTPVELGDGQRMLSVEGSSYYNASLALKLDTIPELIGRHGAFIGMPTRHILLSLPFVGPITLQKLQFLMFATRAAEQQGPGSLSHRVYWYHEGAWHEIAFEMSPNRINVMQPRALTEYLQTMDEGETDEG